MKKTKRIVFALIFLSAATYSTSLWAQPQASANTYSSSGRNFKRGVAAVLFASIGGAVLGLSTLSFYGKPQEHTDNITNGALVGFVAGLSYVAYDSSRPQPVGNYDISAFPTSPDQKLRRTSMVASAPEVPLFQYQIDF